MKTLSSYEMSRVDIVNMDDWRNRHSMELEWHVLRCMLLWKRMAL